MKTTTPYGKNLKLTIVFILGVTCLIVVSLLWRISLLVTQSSVNEKQQFIVAIGNPTKKIICFTPETKSVSILKINKPIYKNTIGKSLEIPIDAYVYGNVTESIAEVFWKSIFTFHNTDTINDIDKLKLWWYIQSIHADTITEESVQLPLSEDIYSHVIQKLFIDKTLYQEAQTIQIVNATGLSGFGNRLARLLTNIGGNVIMVGAGTTQEKSSLVYTDSLSYSHKRMQQILHMPFIHVNAKPVIADIIITIGKDKINTQIF